MGSLPSSVDTLKKRLEKTSTRTSPNTNRKSPKTKHTVTSSSKAVQNHTISEETKNLIVNKFHDASISRVMSGTAGKKDKISAKINGTKEEQSKRLLFDSKTNVHRNYLEEHPNNPVGERKFFHLRPQWVIPLQKQSHHVCKCVYHENIDLICSSLVNKARIWKLEYDYKNADFMWKKTLKFMTRIVFGEIVRYPIRN